MPAAVPPLFPPADPRPSFLRRQGPLLVSMATIGAVVLWGLVAPAALSRFFGGALAAITRNFGWLYLWVVLVLMAVALLRAVREDWDAQQRRDKALRRKMRALVEPAEPGGTPS